jgi:hypothetical protein
MVTVDVMLQEAESGGARRRRDLERRASHALGEVGFEERRHGPLVRAHLGHSRKYEH